MHAMFVGKMITIDDDIFLARQSPPGAFIRFENDRFESALSQMQGSGEAGNSPADDDGIVM